MKYKWMRKLAKKLPEHIWKERRAEIESYVTGSKKEIKQKVEESLCRQLKIVCVGSAVFFLLMAALMISWMCRDRQIVITRNERGGEVKEESLKIKTGEGDVNYSLSVQPKGYLKKEVPQVLKKGEVYLAKHLKGENTSISNVKKALFMPEKIDGENIEVQWGSSDLTLIDEEGNVFSKNVKEPVIVWLSAVLTCQEQRRIAKFPVCVVPGTSGKKKTKKEKVIEKIRQIEQEHIERETFRLPKSLKGGTISKDGENSQIPSIACIGIFCIVLLWYREKQKYKQKKQQAELVSKKEYPAIIHRLVLYLETGMSVPLVFHTVFQEYEKKKEAGKSEEMFVYEQIGTACRQMDFGVPQTEVFKNLGRRLQLSSYRKLSTLLIQSITRGSKELFSQLKEEEEAAFFQRKELAKRQGEEASTKLLAPMIVMLVVILGLLMFPALSTFS